MSVVEFIRNCGFGEACRVLRNARGCSSVRLYDKYEFSTDDLKQYVDAWDLVVFIGDDLKGAEKVYEFTKNSVNIAIGEIAIGEKVVPVCDLKKAIDLVKSIVDVKKTIEELRKEFECVDDIHLLLSSSSLVFVEMINKYQPTEYSDSNCSNAMFLNGAWSMFQKLKNNQGAN